MFPRITLVKGYSSPYYLRGPGAATRDLRIFDELKLVVPDLAIEKSTTDMTEIEVVEDGADLYVNFTADDLEDAEPGEYRYLIFVVQGGDVEIPLNTPGILVVLPNPAGDS